MDINEWYGRKNVQLIVRDIRASKEQASAYLAERERFEAIRRGASFSSEEGIYPSREDFAAVYKFIIASVRNGYDTLSHRDISAKLSRNFNVDIGYIKLKIIIMVLKELNIITIDEVKDEVYKFVIHYTSSKTDLEKSTLLRRLRSQLAR